MEKILFVPLNTNHVLIFSGIMQSLTCGYTAICHDRVSDAPQYHTESILKKKRIPYVHFPEKLERSLKDSILTKVISFLKIRKQVRYLLEHTESNAIVLAIDNDPIAQVFIEEAKRRGKKTVLIQEALIRPYEYSEKKEYLSEYFYHFLRFFKVYLTYTQYASSLFDKMLVGGKRAYDIMRERGIPEEKMIVVGQPKYDAVMSMIEDYIPPENERKVYLFAASTKIVQDAGNIGFLKKIIDAAKDLGIYMIVKLHPRAPTEPSDIYDIVGSRNTSYFEVIKKGDDTFELLKKADALITVSSTVVLEALMLNKECIIGDYLAGESRLGYDVYNAVHSIDREDAVYDALSNALYHKKKYENKKRLLEEELYKLDGQAGKRAAELIEHICNGNKI